MALKISGDHGGNVYAAARDLSRPVTDILDFSASINPLGPSPAVRRTLADGIRLIRHYPDPDCVGLRRILASRWRLSPAHFVIGNGSTELIDLIPRALGVRSALIAGPTFSEYACALRRAGTRSITVSAMRSEGYRPPLQRITFRLRQREARRTAVDAVFLCNPNSPTGQVCDPVELRSLIELADRSGIWIILDETFIEYCEERSVLPWLVRHPRLLILRSFTKFYSLPGLRIGYSVSSPLAATLLRRYQPPWSVNVMAQHAAEAAIRDRDHARRCLAYLRQERERFASRLSSIPGLVVFPSRANFLLLELPEPYDARAVTVELRRRGLLIRDCSSVPGLSPRSIRVAVLGKGDNDRFLAALKKALR